MEYYSKCYIGCGDANSLIGPALDACAVLMVNILLDVTLAQGAFPAAVKVNVTVPALYQLRLVYGSCR